MQTEAKSSRSKKRLSRSAIAAVALMDSGIADLSKIAQAVGLPTSQVAELAELSPVERRQVADWISDDFAFRLRRNILCPECGMRIYIAPCLRCRIKHL